MTTKDLLIAARARIAQREHWTQGSYARDATGVDVHYGSPQAVCWCLAGALLREIDFYGEPPDAVRDHDAVIVLKRARTQLIGIGGHGLGYMNDTSEHAEILRLCDLAIAAQPTQEERR